jgi:hypothetical protein
MTLKMSARILSTDGIEFAIGLLDLIAKREREKPQRRRRA